MGPASPRALVVTRSNGPHVARLLMSLGYSVELQDPRSFRSLEDRARDASLLVADLHQPGAHGGVGLARKLRAHNPSLPVVLLSDSLDAADLVELDEALPGAPTVRTPPNGRVLAMAVAAAQEPPVLPELLPHVRPRTETEDVERSWPAEPRPNL
jgi:CheY-like chemotaxis protein